MIVADSSVWIDFFRDVPTRQVEALIRHIDRGEVLIGDLILCEILQGSRTDTQFRRRQRQLSAFGMIAISDGRVAVEAAANYRSLRATGFTVRKTINTLIATRCILDDIPLLYSDRDFDPFVAHLGLRSVLDEAGVN